MGAILSTLKDRPIQATPIRRFFAQVTDIMAEGVWLFPDPARGPCNEWGSSSRCHSKRRCDASQTWNDSGETQCGDSRDSRHKTTHDGGGFGAVAAAFTVARDWAVATRILRRLPIVLLLVACGGTLITRPKHNRPIHNALQSAPPPIRRARSLRPCAGGCRRLGRIG